MMRARRSTVYPIASNRREGHTGLYLYCIVSEPPGDLAGTLGLHRGELHTIDYKDLFVVVSETDDTKPIATAQCAEDHERVIRTVLEVTTPLPFKFGTLLSPRALNDFIEDRREGLLRSLDKVRDCFEVHLRAKRKGNLATSSDPAARANTSAQVERFAHQLSAQLKGVLQDSVGLDASRAGALFAAAHLVRRDQFSEYKRRIEEMYRPEIEITLEGPSAPASFSEL